MHASSDHDVAAARKVTGNLLRLGEGHEVAIYMREGSCWVAEFRDGRCQLLDAATWFRSPGAPMMSCHRWRAAALDTMQRLPPEIVDRIERLHRQRAQFAVDRPIDWSAPLRAARRWIAVLASIRGVKRRSPAS
jgi:hypothetical protein